MGITLFSKSLIEKALEYKPDIKSVIELGSQNDYTTGEENPPFANELYKSLGVNIYSSIDLAGDNYSYKVDLSNKMMIEPFTDNSKPEPYDLVTDFGTSEHIVAANGFTTISFHGGHINSVYPSGVRSIEIGYYNCWLNKHNLLRVSGLMINENPLTGNWPLHGYSYLSKHFYDEFCKVSDYEIIEQGEEPATGNTIDGWNKWAILKKTGNKFPPFEEFNNLPIFRE